MTIHLHGGPYDGADVPDDETFVQIDAEVFSWSGVELASYRVNRERTEAHFTGSRKVWPHEVTE